MALEDVVAQIDAEIAKLEQVKALLSGGVAATLVEKGKRGRPKGSKNAAESVPAKKTAGKRQLSPEGRKAIADAMKRRWAEKRKANA